MSTAEKLSLLSVADYLAGELISPVKHEYVAGVVYAMAGGRNVHTAIASNTSGALHGRLRGRSCRAYNSDAKIRIRLPTHVRFYYPDASVICRPNPPGDSFHDEPAVLFEVLSESTRRIDEGEKKDAYLTIPSLGLYVLVDQEAPLVIAHRRTENGFVREVYHGLDSILPMPEIEIDVPIAEIYEGIVFTPERRAESTDPG